MLKGADLSFALNVIDAAVACAGERAARSLAMLSQGGGRWPEFPARQALLPLYAAHLPAGKHRAEAVVRSVVETCSLIELAAEEYARQGRVLTDARHADLCAFFIDRARHAAGSPWLWP